MKTAADIKDELPEVQIQIRGKVYTGQVYGRKLDYPVVFVAETGDEFEFSWTAIQRAVIDGNILKA